MSEESRDKILADFQELTGIHDCGMCLSILESFDWNLENAVGEMLCDNDETSTTKTGDIRVTASTSTVEDKSTEKFSTDRITTIASTSNDTPIKTISNTCSNNAVDSSPIAILTFDIGLKEEDFQFNDTIRVPNTESIRYLKKKFVDNSMERILIYLTSKKNDIDTAKIDQYVRFDGCSRITESDNDTILKSLKLPSHIKLSASIDFDGNTPSGSVNVNTKTNSSLVPIEFLFYMEGPSDRRREADQITLRVQPDCKLSKFKRDIAGLSDITPAKQSFKLFASQIPNENTMCSFIETLNSVDSSICKDNTMALQDFGLQPGQKYILNLAKVSDSAKPKSSGVAVKRTDDDLANGATSETLVSNRKSFNRGVSIKSNRDDDVELSDVDYSYDDCDDGYLMFDDANKTTDIYSNPLISDTICMLDPKEAVSTFYSSFLERYYQEDIMLPPFSISSFDEAVQNTLNQTYLADRRPLFLYLHNDQSVACHIFCQQVICSPEMYRFLNENDFSLWPWDLTVTRAKERLMGWLSTRFVFVANHISSLAVDNFPLLIMLGKVGGQTEMLAVVEGTGQVKIPKPPTALDFPPLGLNPFIDTSPIVQNTSGSLQADAIIARLYQVHTDYLERLGPERVTEEARIAREQVRVEQEAAYQESLRIDRLKAKQKADEEEDLRRQAELDRQKEEMTAVERENRRLELGASLIPEPPANTEGCATLRFRLPPGMTCTPSGVEAKSLTRRFNGSLGLEQVKMYVESLGFPAAQYKMLTVFPRRDLMMEDDKVSLIDLKLVPQETLILEER